MTGDPVWTVQASGIAGPECLDRVHALLADLWDGAPDVGDEDRMLFEIAVVEVAGNIVEHGCPPPVAYELELAVHTDHLEATFHDSGEPTGDLPVHDAQMPDEMAETGRGLPIVRAAVDVVEQGRVDGANRWYLRRERIR